MSQGNFSMSQMNQPYGLPPGASNSMMGQAMMLPQHPAPQYNGSVLLSAPMDAGMVPAGFPSPTITAPTNPGTTGYYPQSPHQGSPAYPYYPMANTPNSFNGPATAAIAYSATPSPTPLNSSGNQMTPNHHQRSGAGTPATGGTNVFVASLPSNYDDNMLLELFQPYGSIVSAKVSRDLETGNSKSFGFVRFEHPESALRAIVALNGHSFKGGNSKLHVVLSSHTENESAVECDRLYIRNLPTNAATEDLLRIFGQYGTVLEANIQPGNARVSANITIGFVRMSSVEEARLAKERVNNTRPLDPNSAILVRFMETADMKAARKVRNTDGASGRNSASRNSPDHLAGSTSSRPGSAVSPHLQTSIPTNAPAPMPPMITQPPAAVMPVPTISNAPFPTFGDIFMMGAASEGIARFVITNHAGHTIALMAADANGFYIRLTDVLQHERVANELNGVALSNGNSLHVMTLRPMMQQAPHAGFMPQGYAPQMAAFPPPHQMHHMSFPGM